MAQHFDGLNQSADEIHPPTVPASDQIEEIKQELEKEVTDHIEGTPEKTDLDDALQSE